MVDWAGVAFTRISFMFWGSAPYESGAPLKLSEISAALPPGNAPECCQQVQKS